MLNRVGRLLWELKYHLHEFKMLQLQYCLHKCLDFNLVDVVNHHQFRLHLHSFYFQQIVYVFGILADELMFYSLILKIFQHFDIQPYHLDLLEVSFFTIKVIRIIMVSGCLFISRVYHT